jgi:hypothetical protein
MLPVSLDLPFMIAPLVFSNVYSCKCLILNLKYYYSLKFVPVSNILITTEYYATFCSSFPPPPPPPPQPRQNACDVSTDSPACAMCAQGCLMFHNDYILFLVELISLYYNRMLLIGV